MFTLFRPAHSPLYSLRSRVSVAGIRRTLIEASPDVCAEFGLNLHNIAGRYETKTSVNMRPELDAFVSHFDEFGEAENLESAAVCDYSAAESHKIVNPLRARDNIRAGAKVKVIRVGENRFCAGLG
jgi:hypothetical protein